MEVISVSPLRAGSVVWQARPGRWALTAVCKATFTLEAGEAKLAAEQEDVALQETHWDDDPRASLHAPADLAPFKPRADVVLVGHAFAPQGWPVRAVTARLVVGTLDKSIEVFGQRTWTREGELREGPRWTKMALRYERAAGGRDTWNPVGLSLPALPDGQGRVHAPNLQPPGIKVTSPPEFMAPVGFGPIAAGWLLRRERLGERADAWSDEDLGSLPLGDDFDFGYFQAAPPDQQLEELPEEVSIQLENLHPESKRLVTRLPAVRPRAYVDLPGGTVHDLMMIADTLWIDTDRSICTVTWRGRIQIEARDQPGRILIGLEEHTVPLSWAKLSALSGRGDGRSVTHVLPVEEVAEPASPPSRSRASWPGNNGATTLDEREGTVLTQLPIGRPATPFVAQSAHPRVPDAPAQAPRPPLRKRSTLTMEVVPGQGSVLPFAGLQRETPQSVSMPPERPVSIPPPEWPISVPPPPAAVPPSPISIPSPPAAVPPPPISVPPPPAAVPSPVFSAPSKLPSFMASAASLPAFVDPAPGPVEAPSLLSAAEPSPEPIAEAIELIWFEPSYVQPIRQHADWAARLAERKAAKPAVAPPPGGKGAAPDLVRSEELSRRVDLSAILLRGAPASLAEIEEAALEAVNEGGGLSAPLVLVGGDMVFPLDERELLKGVAGAAAPLAASDKRLKEILDRTDETLKTPLQGSAAVAQELLAQILEAWAAANRVHPAGYLEANTQRMLLELRRYQRRDLLKGTWIRALVTPTGSDAALPAYLPAALSNALPLYKQLPVRLVAEALPQQDQYETEEIALRVVAIGRVVSARSRRR